jgi:hypothetical protein
LENCDEKRQHPWFHIRFIREGQNPLTVNKTHYQFTQMPIGAVAHSVDAHVCDVSGRKALRVTLDEAARNGEYGINYVDMPTFLMLPCPFGNGEISVDILSRLRPDAPYYARGFAGLAYRISDHGNQFEAVYVRPLNGRSLNVPSPRENRAVQFFAYPDWKFDRLRDAFPDGRFEAGADILPDQWLHLSVTVEDRHVHVRIDGNTVLELDDIPVMASEGHVGLWVDIGTEAFFSDLIIRS